MDHKYALEQAAVVLFNPHLYMRTMLRSTLMGLGFKDVYDYGELDRTRDAIIERAPDLVLLDLDEEKENTCALIREIRQTSISDNPFVAIIALSWQPNSATVNNSMEAGIDDLIVMPISIKSIFDRVDTLIQNRKEFIVTSSYVGPDRRATTDARPDALGLGAIKVPNSLRYRTIGDHAAIASAEAVNAVTARINHHRLNRYAQRIPWLIGEIQKSKEDGAENSKITIERHDEIGCLIENIAFDLSTQGYEHLLEITDSMLRLLDFIREKHSQQFYEFMRLHALSITATLMESDGAAVMVKQALKETAAYLDRVQAA